MIWSTDFIIREDGYKNKFEEAQKKATYSFSANNVITSGKMGIVYKAMFPDSTSLVVKRFHASHNQS